MKTVKEYQVKFNKKTFFLGAIAALGVIAAIGPSLATDLKTNPRLHEVVSYFGGHIHEHDGDTHGAPQHSGGTDAYGCHNGSVPYHCH